MTAVPPMQPAGQRTASTPSRTNAEASSAGDLSNRANDEADPRDASTGDSDSLDSNTGDANTGDAKTSAPRERYATPSRLVAPTTHGPVDDGLSERDLSHPSRMTTQFGLLARWLAGIFFAPVQFPPQIDTAIATCAREGVPVYVMKTVSFLDTLFFNFAFVRAKLPLAEFTNGPALTAFQPWRQAIAVWWRRRWSTKAPRPNSEIVTGLLRRRRSILLFLRRGFSFTQLAAGPPADPHLIDLIVAQRAVTFPIFVIPQVLIWERSAGSDGTTSWRRSSAIPRRPVPSASSPGSWPTIAALLCGSVSP